MRAGDMVKGNNEQVMVMSVWGEEFVACGFPFGYSKVAHYEITASANDEEHLAMLRGAYNSNATRREYAIPEIMTTKVEDPWLDEVRVILRFEHNKSSLISLLSRCKNQDDFDYEIRLAHERLG